MNFFERLVLFSFFSPARIDLRRSVAGQAVNKPFSDKNWWWYACFFTAYTTGDERFKERLDDKPASVNGTNLVSLPYIF